MCNGVQFDFTPLHWAACFGHLEVVLLLLECSADKNPKVKVRTCRRTGAVRSTIAALRRPLSCSACGGLQDGRTLLHLAAQTGQLEVARLLLERDVDMEAKDKVCALPKGPAAASAVSSTIVRR